MKRCFVECKGGKITIYPITPKEQEMRLFREEQLASIPKKEKFYASDSVGPGIVDSLMKWDPTHTNNDTSKYEFLFNKNKFEPAINFVDDIEHNDDFYDGFVFVDKGSVNDRFVNMQLETLRVYLIGKNESVPFIFSSEEELPRYFLPSKEHIDLYKNRIYRYCIQLTRIAYLLHSLENDYMRLLKGASPEELRKLLSFYTFEEPIERDAEELKERDMYIRQLDKATYGRVMDEETRTDKLITRAVFDRPFIEDVKRIALK